MVDISHKKKNQYPQVSRVYQNHHLDSSRWAKFSPRNNDIIVATTSKSGTTWTQWIILHLLFPKRSISSLDEYSPWLDYPNPSAEDTLAMIEAQKHRRVLKTHLPLDVLPWFEEARYVIVSRDLRDMGLSIWHHYQSLTEQAYEIVNQTKGNKLPTCPEDFDTFWQNWTSRGVLDWENDGFPGWSSTHFVKTWWKFKHLENILFVHYNDLKKDPTAEIKRIATHIGVTVSEKDVQTVVEQTRFDTMKQKANRTAPAFAELFHGGKRTFFNQGKSGRWKSELKPQHLELYEQMVSKTLSPDCRSWLERGREAFT